ncbi:uncharacterized protein LOC116611961 [Nematostella vectensis]|uniref:uncharacterized protein LOC116611961 n=1 Tax=Nematostella vectensis TaxID=45351 RepID=UPI0013902A10|nr:uncharacterized protein LOC116611961 [Nematostella vectensis]
MVAVPVPQTKSPKMKVDESQLDRFLRFITSSHILQDLPFGQRHLCLSNGEILDVPNVIRGMIPQRIMDQYTEYCKEEEITPLSQSTMARILTACHATVRTSLHGLDYTSADGAKAFDILASIVDRLDGREKSREWSHTCRAALKTGKQYIKSDYKTGQRGGTARFFMKARHSPNYLPP